MEVIIFGQSVSLSVIPKMVITGHWGFLLSSTPERKGQKEYKELEADKGLEEKK